MSNYSELPTPEVLKQTADAVTARGIKVHVMEDEAAALSLVRSLIPGGATVMTAGSVTLKQIGLEELLKTGTHPWRNLRAEILAEKDPVQQSALRKQGTLAEYYLGSVQAISVTGEIVVASATGSQLSPYAYSSSNIIWIAGAQKIVPTIEEALRRTREYALPLEDQRMKNVGMKVGSFIGKLLIIEREAAYLRRNVNLILINKVLGF